MKKQKVVIYRKVSDQVLSYLKETCEVKYFPGLDSDSYPHFLEELQEAHALMGAGLKIDRELLEQAPHLKIVSNISVGYDNVDLGELKRRDIILTNTPGVLVDSTADAVLSLILSTARRVPELHDYVQSGQWDRVLGEERFGVDVHHKVLGIIGVGSIGKAIAKRAHFGFDMPILYHNRSRSEQVEQEFQARYCSLDELLKDADFVCLMTPSTPETEKLIGEREFRLMKDTAIFINGSRGKNVDEEALVKALQQGWIRGAGLDVYEKEPLPKDHPLMGLTNVVTLPHIGSATVETRFKMAMLAAENVVETLQGLEPKTAVKM